MEEDLELNRLVKAALEARQPFVWERSVMRRPRPVARWCLPWAAAALLAASLAVVASFHQPGRSGGSSVEEALGLLAEAEEVAVEAGERQTAAALLVAWQEAPLRDRQLEVGFNCPKEN